jgi:hypothetical protein
MAKKKTSKRQRFCLKDMPIVKSKKAPQLRKHDPRDFFKSQEKVSEALLTSLEEGKPGDFLEILNVFLGIKNESNERPHRIGGKS